jgi:hypothetical protein
VHRLGQRPPSFGDTTEEYGGPAGRLSEGYVWGDARQGSVECPGLSAGCQAYRGPPGERGRDEMARAGPGRSGSSGELRQVQGAWAWLSKGGGVASDHSGLMRRAGQWASWCASGPYESRQDCGREDCQRCGLRLALQ